MERSSIHDIQAANAGLESWNKRGRWEGGVYGVRCLAGQRERPGALVRMSIRLSICVSVGALWELAAYCGSPVGGLCAPVHEKRPRERPPLPVAADERFAAAHTPVGDDDREGEGERVGEEDGCVGG